MPDIEEIVDMIMRILDQAEISEDEVLDLDFEAEGELQVELYNTYVKLLKFVHDRDLRRKNPDLDRKERAVFQNSLNKIVQMCDPDRIDRGS
jgi:hypothetical protein